MSRLRPALLFVCLALFSVSSIVRPQVVAAMNRAMNDLLASLRHIATAAPAAWKTRCCKEEYSCRKRRTGLLQ